MRGHCRYKDRNTYNLYLAALGMARRSSNLLSCIHKAADDARVCATFVSLRDFASQPVSQRQQQNAVPLAHDSPLPFQAHYRSAGGHLKHLHFDVLLHIEQVKVQALTYDVLSAAQALLQR